MANEMGRWSCIVCKDSKVVIMAYLKAHLQRVTETNLSHKNNKLRWNFSKFLTQIPCGCFNNYSKLVNTMKQDRSFMHVKKNLDCCFQRYDTCSLRELGEGIWWHDDSMFRAVVREAEKWVHYIQVLGEPRHEQQKDYLPLHWQWQCWQ